MTEGTVKVVIEGHTDAKGRPQYNDALSLRRAAAVRDYLVQVKGVSAQVLMVEGKGSRKPIDPDPYNPRNRRVQFRAG
jgi:outer membrane protein OmpA-like peptidoglycan-associated protein